MGSRIGAQNHQGLGLGNNAEPEYFEASQLSAIFFKKGSNALDSAGGLSRI